MKRSARNGLYFISPSLIYFFLFWIFPLILAIYYSFTKWSVGQRPKFMGVKNYLDLISDPLFANAIRASAKITVLAVIGTMVIALGIAVLLNDEKLRGSRLFKAIIMIPVVSDWVASGLVWQLIFLPYSGVLPGLFYNLGLSDLMGLRWTASASLAPIAIVIFIIWKTTGLYTIIFLAGLKSVPKSYLEAAYVDGANAFQTFFYVTMPILQPITVFALVSSFVGTIGLFEPVFMLTGGGPADATRVLPIFLYENFFQFSNAGYASAAGILFLLFCLGFALFAGRLLQYSHLD
jgi:ABC-type sugar transport system permease subunit